MAMYLMWCLILQVSGTEWRNSSDWSGQEWRCNYSLSGLMSDVASGSRGLLVCLICVDRSSGELTLKLKLNLKAVMETTTQPDPEAIFIPFLQSLRTVQEGDCQELKHSTRLHQPNAVPDTRPSMSVCDQSV
ncbi:uncharacterized protein BDV14DRAFT_70047 [Aspergillus stella-maris]|uniref:uncharacterized protein n=1 Tax=Aspergillus stella-maris TaxID=1810926 RepID=UPI003CCCC658